jgi:GxxExxY protein
MTTLTHRETYHLTDRVIGAAIEVHREIGPGMLESTYNEALCIELGDRGIPFVQQPFLPVMYKERKLKTYYRPDFVIAGQLIVELKAVEKLIAVHRSQLLTYLKHADLKVGLLLNFNSVVLKEGLWRAVR